MDALVSAHDALEVPRALVAREIDGLRNQMFQQFGGAPANKDLDLKSLLPDEMFQENAERRVKLGLVLAELVEKLELKVDADRVRETVEEMASTYEDPQEVVNWYYSNQEQLASIESRVLEDQMVEKLLDNAKIIEKKCSYQEALGQAQAGQ
jgi:trigger factor